MLLHSTIIKSLQSNPFSLADLQPVTQVSLPTLRKAVQELTDHRWIRVTGQAEANGGRPAMLFGLDETYYVLLGIHMQLPGLRLIVSDLVGTVLDETEAFQQSQPTPEQVVKTIVEYAQDVMVRLPHRKLLGIGIAAPGFTDPETGNIISIGRVSGWQNFPICQRLRTQLNVPVRIANDVDCMAFAEFQHTRKSFASNLAYVGFDEGVKVSMFLNGELYKGALGNTGLIVNRFLRVPGREFTVEDQRRILSISGLGELFETRVQQLMPHEQRDYEGLLAASNRQRLKLIFSGAEAGLPICQDIVSMLHAVLSTAIANIIYIIQPDAVVIGGILSAMPPNIFHDLTLSIRGHLSDLFANQVHIEQARFISANISALGANYHFIENYLLSESFDLFVT